MDQTLFFALVGLQISSPLLRVSATAHRFARKKAGTLKQTSGKSYRVVGQKTQQRRTNNGGNLVLISFT